MLMELGLVDLLHHFQHLWKFQHLKTWYQVRQGRFLRARCAYILGKYWHRFKILRIWYVRNYSSDHFALLARLLEHPMQCHDIYLRRRHAFTLSLPAPEEFGLADNKFQYLKALELTPLLLNCPPRPQWMSETSIQLINKRFDLRRNP